MLEFDERRLGGEVVVPDVVVNQLLVPGYPASLRLQGDQRIRIEIIAFALAAKDTVENLFGSVTVLIDRPFQIGDWVVIGDQEGTVEEIGFRSTRIRTFYNSVVTVPNSRPRWPSNSPTSLSCSVGKGPLPTRVV